MAVDTQANLLTRSNQVRTALGAFENSSSRIGGLLRDIVESLFGVTGRFSVKAYGAVGNGTTPAATEATAFAAAAAAAELVGGTVYVPMGTYGDGTGWDFALPSNVTLEGDGDKSVLVNCAITCTGSTGSEIAFTAPVAKGALTLPIPATGLTDAYLRIASVVNSLGTDGGAEQLGHSTGEYSAFAEFVHVLTGAAASATLHQGVLFPYSNTPGASSAPSWSTSVARVVTFHTSSRIRRLKMLGVKTSSVPNIRAELCRDLVIDDVLIDVNDITTQSVQFIYCMDCEMRNCRVIGKKTSVPPASAADPYCVFSSQRVVFNNCTINHGRQGLFISYISSQSIRGGPSIQCGASNCRAFDCDLDGFTSVWGCLQSFFIGCQTKGCEIGFRIRDRGAQVIACSSFMSDVSTGQAILIDQAAVIDSIVSNNVAFGHLNGIRFTHSLPGYEALEALLGCGSCLIQGNILRGCGDHGIQADQAYTSAVLVGPRIIDNEIHSVADDAIQIDSYNNGTIIEGNRISGVLAGKVGIRWVSNIKRLWVSNNHVFAAPGAEATSSALTGAGVGSFMTDAVTFPGGEADALLYIGNTFSNMAAPFASIFRGSSAYVKPLTPANGITGASVLGQNPVFTGSGTPESVVHAGIGALYMRSDTGALYRKTSGTGNTGWVTP